MTNSDFIELLQHLKTLVEIWDERPDDLADFKTFICGDIDRVINEVKYNQKTEEE